MATGDHLHQGGPAPGLLKVTQGGVGGTRVPDQMPRRKEVAQPGWGAGDVQAGAGWHFPALPNPRPSTMAEKAPLCDSRKLALLLLLSTTSSGEADPHTSGASVCGWGVLPLNMPSE